MKQFARLLALSAVFGLAAAPAALAADYDPELYPETQAVDEYKPVEIGSGWYIRGDIGYTISGSGSVPTYRTFTGGIYGTDAFDTSSVEGDFSFGVGVGYIFNNWLRFDATAERFKGAFAGTTSDPNPCPGVVTAPADDTTCASNDAADFTAYSLMANAYLDLGKYHGITPYVGAGAGLTFMNWEALSSNAACVDGTDTCPPNTLVNTQHPGLSSTRFTWALMAGASYNLTKNTKLDVGYRYSKVEGGDFFGFDGASAAAGAAGPQARDRGFENHEVRVGLRYEIW